MCLQELDTRPDHPAWAMVNPPIVFSDLPKPYSPILFLGFNKDEYANLPIYKDEVTNDGTEVEDAKATKEPKVDRNWRSNGTLNWR